MTKKSNQVKFNRTIQGQQVFLAGRKKISTNFDLLTVALASNLDLDNAIFFSFSIKHGKKKFLFVYSRKQNVCEIT
jgi:hypothetical protein